MRAVEIAIGARRAASAAPATQHIDVLSAWEGTCFVKLA